MVYSPPCRFDSLYTTAKPPENLSRASPLWIPGCQTATTGKSKIYPSPLSSSNRCCRKSGKRDGNPPGSVDDAGPRFRKPVPRKMKSRKRGENHGVGYSVAHGLHSWPEKHCGKQRFGVQSAFRSRIGACLRRARFAHRTLMEYSALFPTPPGADRRKTGVR